MSSLVCICVLGIKEYIVYVLCVRVRERETEGEGRDRGGGRMFEKSVAWLD